MEQRCDASIIATDEMIVWTDIKTILKKMKKKAQRFKKSKGFLADPPLSKSSRASSKKLRWLPNERINK